MDNLAHLLRRFIRMADVRHRSQRATIGLETIDIACYNLGMEGGKHLSLSSCALTFRVKYVVCRLNVGEGLLVGHGSIW